MWQAEYVRDCLRKAHPGLEVEFLKMVTEGDKILDSPLAKIGGKGLFVKELEKSLLDKRADIAVHSMKDVPVHLPLGLHLSTICIREDPRDAFVSKRFSTLDDLPNGACVGTSSLRRQCQLRRTRPDLVIEDLRGNVGSRLDKLDRGVYDAIILASAGLLRLGLKDRIAQYIPTNVMLPAVGQGAVGIECRQEDDQTNALLSALNHQDTKIRVSGERAMNHRLEGGCQVPIAGHAELYDDQIVIRGLVGRPDGSEVIEGEMTGKRKDAVELGTKLADDLLARGAGLILKELYHKE